MGNELSDTGQPNGRILGDLIVIHAAGVPRKHIVNAANLCLRLLRRSHANHCAAASSTDPPPTTDVQPINHN